MVESPKTKSSSNTNNTVVIQKEIGLSHFQCPLLKSMNYTIWSIRIKTILEANGLWEQIEPSDDTEIDIKKTRQQPPIYFKP